MDKLLYKLTIANGIAGNESQIRTILKEETKEVAQEYVQDGLGGLFAVHSGEVNGPKVMLAGHLDEVGFMVTQITEKGFLKFQNIGGWWNQVLLAQQVDITTTSGSVFQGVIGSKPPHILSAEARKHPVELSDMFIDLGATSKEEVESWGIRPGDMITPHIETRRLNGTKYLLGKAWDNRVGVAVAIRALNELHKSGHPNVVYAGANVQEEVGLRGSRVAAHMIAPDISFALDTGIPGDTPGIAPHEADSILGKGPQIVIYDASMVAHKGLRDFVIRVAEEENIPFQYASIPGGGTDAGGQHISLNGIPSLAICIPVRYLHTHGSIIHEDDVEYTVQLITAVVKRLTAQAVASIKENN